MHFAKSDYTPFAFERSLRADRVPVTPAPPTSSASAPDPGAAHRLLRSAGPVVEQPLSSLAKRWCDGFEANGQPRTLCRQYPRIANRLALCWADVSLSTALFSELLIDRRGGRKGFPAPVLAELRSLAAANTARTMATTANERTGVLRG